jgi:hypothetical protein
MPTESEVSRFFQEISASRPNLPFEDTCACPENKQGKQNVLIDNNSKILGATGGTHGELE